jgi:hypothetical protein
MHIGSAHEKNDVWTGPLLKNIAKILLLGRGVYIT